MKLDFNLCLVIFYGNKFVLKTLSLYSWYSFIAISNIMCEVNCLTNAIAIAFLKSHYWMSLT